MRIAFAKHTLSFAVVAALLGLAASLTLPAAQALAGTGGASAASGATVPSAPAGGNSTAGGSAPTAPHPGRQTLATWFGPGFYGHQTACGQTMSHALIGVASRTLACGTLVQIGYRGRRLTVPVVDRGPYGHIGAVWDLTAGAARALKIGETVRIATAIVGALPNSPTLGQPPEASTPATAEAPAESSAAASTAAASGGAAAS
jgi:rare lipoprotein A (peptidoglycan hydrolase)